MAGKLPDSRAWRDLALFIVGLLGVLHEVFFTALDRPSLVVLFAAMMGLPLYLRKNGGG